MRLQPLALCLERPRTLSQLREFSPLLASRFHFATRLCELTLEVLKPSIQVSESLLSGFNFRYTGSCVRSGDIAFADDFQARPLRFLETFKWYPVLNDIGSTRSPDELGKGNLEG
jgi:hypothetical protein